MKLKLFILIFLSVPCICFSQGLGKVSFGMQAGYNISSFDINYTDRLTSLNSLTSSDSYGRFNGALFAEAGLYNGIGLRLEGEYIHKGGTVSSSIISDNGLTPVSREYESQLKYISFSLLPFYFKEVSSGIGPVFYAGPYAGFLVSAKELTTQTTFTQAIKTEKDIKNQLTGTDAGFIFGGGIRIQNFTAGMRYYLGFTNVIDESKSGVTAEAKNRLFSFIISYTFSK